MNLDLTNKNDITVNEYINILSEKGFYPQINKPTRVTENTATNIDHIFLKNTANKLNSLPFILTTAITDHYATILYLTESNDDQNYVNVSYNKKTINHTKLMKKLEREDWQEIYREQNVTTATKKFILKLKYLINLCTSVSQKKINNSKKLKPWITQGLINSIKERDKLKRLLLNNPNNHDIQGRYKIFRNTVTKLIKKTKIDYYKQKFTEAKNNVKEVWNLIKDATNEKKVNKSENIKNIRTDNDKVVTDNREICNNFNNYYAEIGHKMAQDIIKNSDVLVNSASHNIEKVMHTIYLYPVTENEIKNCIHSLKNKGSPGEDGLCSITLKTSMEYISKPLQYLINLIFQQGIFPEILKTSTVIPIFKQGDITQMSNYRPISLISNISKIVEKCLKKRILEHLNKFKIISPLQFGFKTGVSTVDAIHCVTQSIHNSLNQNKKPLAIFLDLAKAFDTVSHKRLLEKLENYGLRGICGDIISDYLTCRTQRVKINSEYSDERTITYGIPQGTVLGPLLFQIYINDMLNLRTSGQIIAYADDTVLIFSDDTWDGVKTKAEMGLNKIKHWLDANLLTLNNSKTKFLTFSLTAAGQSNIKKIKFHNCINPIDCFTCSDTIEGTASIKYLGLHIDQFMKWDTHASVIVGKIRKLFYKFYQLRELVNKKILVNIYKSLVESIINYSLVIWGGAYDNVLHSVRVTQKRILKIIFEKPNLYPTELLFKDSNLPDIDTLYIISSINFVYRSGHLRQRINYVHDTRSTAKKQIKTPKPNNSAYIKFVDYTGVKLFNLLPHSVKEINNYKKFKIKSKLYILNNLIDFKNLLKI